MTSPILSDIRNTINHVVFANKHYYYIWRHHVVFTWQWWFQLFLTIVPFTFWLFVHKKQNTARVWLSGTFVLLVASCLDFVGSSYGLWYYPYKLLPVIPPFIPWNLMFGLQVMLLLEYKPDSPPIFKAITMSLFNSFVAEPLAMWLGLYVPILWKTVYSVPIYIVIYLVAHRISRSYTFAPLEKSQVNDNTMSLEVLSKLILMSREWSNAKRGVDLIQNIALFFREVLRIDAGFFLAQGMFARTVPLQVYCPWGPFDEESEKIQAGINAITLEVLASLPSGEQWINCDRWVYGRAVCKAHDIQEVSFWRLYFRNQCVGAIVLGRKQLFEMQDEQHMHLYMTHIALIRELCGELILTTRGETGNL